MTSLYTAKAITEGGRNGHSQTTDGKLSFELATPGGTSKKTGPVTNPEELFACGYSACFGSALQYVSGQKKVKLPEDFSVTADVSLCTNDAGGFALQPCAGDNHMLRRRLGCGGQGSESGRANKRAGDAA